METWKHKLARYFYSSVQTFFAGFLLYLTNALDNPDAIITVEAVKAALIGASLAGLRGLVKYVWELFNIKK